MNLFVFVAEAIAGEATKKKPGARHALLTYSSAASFDEAKDAAIAFLEQNGWSFVAVKRGKQADRDTNLIKDEILKSAAENALEHGCGVVVYSDPIPPNA